MVSPPVVSVPVTRDHRSVISGMTEQGRLLVQMHDHAYKGPAVGGFLKHRLRHRAGKLLLLWDGAPIHHSQPIKACLAQEAAGRIHWERLPGYAPALNPDEGVWRSLKRVALRKVCGAAVSELRYAVRLAIARRRDTVSVIQGCISHAGDQLSFTRQQSIRISNHTSDPLVDGGQ